MTNNTKYRFVKETGLALWPLAFFIAVPVASAVLASEPTVKVEKIQAPHSACIETTPKLNRSEIHVVCGKVVHHD